MRPTTFFERCSVFIEAFDCFASALVVRFAGRAAKRVLMNWARALLDPAPTALRAVSKVSSLRLLW